MYFYMEYPSFAKELKIIQARLPEIPTKLAMQITGFVQKVRQIELRKQPGVAETLDWAVALMGTGIESLVTNDFIIHASRTCLLKTQDDLEKLGENEVGQLLESIS